MMKHFGWILLGALAAWLVFDAMSSPEPVPDTTAPYVDSLRAAERARRAVEIDRDALVQALTDSTAAWEAERRNLRSVAKSLRVEADSIAGELRATLDTAGVRMLDQLQAAHAAEVTALEREIQTHVAETTALRAGMRNADLLIRAQRDEIAAWERLDAERQAVEGRLRDYISKQNRDKKLLGLAAIGGLAWGLSR